VVCVCVGVCVCVCGVCVWVCGVCVCVCGVCVCVCVHTYIRKEALDMSVTAGLSSLCVFFARTMCGSACVYWRV